MQRCNDEIGVKANEKVDDSVKVKAGSATGTILRAIAVDSVYGATLYNETDTDVFVKDSNAIIVGTDAVAVDNSSAVANGIITVKAAAGTAGKTASLRIQVVSGAKSSYITVPLEIV